MQSARAGLVIRVHVAVLDLAHGPQIGAVHDFVERCIIAVERETEMTDAAVGKRGFCLGQQIVLQNDFAPDSLIERVQKIEIDVIGLELLQLLIEIPVEIIRRSSQARQAAWSRS